MALSNKERQEKYLATSSDNGCGRLQMMISADTQKKLNLIQKDLGWTKRQVVETAIAQLAEYLSTHT